MIDRPTAEPKFHVGREGEISRSVESLFRHCDESTNPVLAYSRACSKVGYMAQDGRRPELYHLTSALNERKHALTMERWGQPEKAKEHHRDCGRELRMFQHAVTAELTRLRRSLTTPELTERSRHNLEVGQGSPAPVRDRNERDVQLNGGADRAAQERVRYAVSKELSTPQLRARIHDDLSTGRWNQARADLNELAGRPDIGKALPPIDSYVSVRHLSAARFSLVEQWVDRCDMNARVQRGQESLVPLPAQQVRTRIHDALHTGDWSLARLAINELTRRPSIGVPLPDLNDYPRAGTLAPEEHKAMQSRISRCNAIAETQTLEREWRGESRHPEVERLWKSRAQHLAQPGVARAITSQLAKARGGGLER